ncbi:MAG: aminoacyl--tRNA ligase-related protein, partial [Fulvivirga sp.]|uniref:aminoacyl--tRNA ligase-related protein n=1 Tax=Fulvivirga sp. TaxID=1931237 RepID=UPI0032EBBC30
MLEVNRIRAEKEKVISALEKRQLKDAASLINRIIELDDERKATQTKNDEILSEANQLSKQIGQLMKSGHKEEAEAIKNKSSALKSDSKNLTEKLNSLEDELRQLLYKVPNTPNSNVPAGANEEANEVVYEYGAVPQLYEGALPHWDLIKKYDIIDFELGNKVSGAGFPFYKGKGARLQRAMVNFFLDEAVKMGFEEVQPPIVINEDSGYGTGQLPDKDGQMYHIQLENYFLIPTAEVPITNMYRDVILDVDKLPIKHVGYTPCFRREAGSWGAHVRGLNRLHQFDKVEIVQIQHPDKSYE